MKQVDVKGRRREVAAIAKLLHFAELSAKDLNQPFLAYLIRMARHEAGNETLPPRRRAANRRPAHAAQNLN
jgi:hypothetical protein